ncbi:MAG: hypothetical protein ONB44_12815 [candidate division KSB1 bacterium]|nr:hypothetical protein [candidate division KSB1 bacterium]MDZ7303001.1 hypothetical protein [candidate division KSB1 bacterium]MDZ7312491.1 hypothetical protein [candidate division KSB1 bacterium]
MALILSPETYIRLEDTFGKEQAREIVTVLDASLQAVDQKANETLDSIKDKADALITQKKFELKNELTQELATKADIVRLEGVTKADIARLEGVTKADIARLEGVTKLDIARLDRKFTIMFLILLFTTIFVNQNALEFIAKLLGLIK